MCSRRVVLAKGGTKGVGGGVGGGGVGAGGGEGGGVPPPQSVSPIFRPLHQTEPSCHQTLAQPASARSAEPPCVCAFAEPCAGKVIFSTPSQFEGSLAKASLRIPLACPQLSFAQSTVKSRPVCAMVMLSLLGEGLPPCAQLITHCPLRSQTEVKIAPALPADRSRSGAAIRNIFEDRMPCLALPCALGAARVGELPRILTVRFRWSVLPSTRRPEEPLLQF